MAATRAGPQCGRSTGNRYERALDIRQRDEILARMRRQVMANRITARVGKIRTLRVVDDKKIIKAFGTAPSWKTSNG
jgi:hypothetical protein